MPILALVLIVAWLVVVAGWRTWVQARRTGTLTVPAPAVRGSPAWWARTLSTIGFVLAVAAPIADLAGMPRSPSSISRPCRSSACSSTESASRSP